MTVSISHFVLQSSPSGPIYRAESVRQVGADPWVTGVSVLGERTDARICDVIALRLSGSASTMSFTDWWHALNRALRKRGGWEARYAEARAAFDSFGQSIEQAAESIVAGWHKECLGVPPRRGD